MNNILELRGSVVALVTPFTETGEIDYAALGSLVEFHLQNNTDGIVVCGTTGEASTMTEEEYAETIRFVVNKVNHQIPVIAGTGSNSTAHALHNSKIAIEQGVDALLIVTPYYNKPNQRGMYDHYKYISENVDRPIILYNVPGRTGSNLTPKLVMKLANDFDNIIGIKEASGNLNQVMEIINMRQEGFLVFSGDDALALPMIALGAEGCISVAANIFPKEFSELMHAGLNFEMDRAMELQYRYLNLMNLNFIESNPIPVKTGLYLMGMIRNRFRLPLAPLTSEENLRIYTEELRHLNLIGAEILNPQNN